MAKSKIKKIPIEYNRTEKAPKKYTAVYYGESDSFPDARLSRELIGYCAASPVRVFRELFPRTYVVQYKAYDLYEYNKQYDTGRGICLEEIEPTFGIEGKISKLLKQKAIKDCARPSESRFAYGEIANLRFTIKESLRRLTNNLIFNKTPRYNEMKQTYEEIMQVLQRVDHA